MNKLEVVGLAVTPDGGELVLYQRGDSFILQIDSYDLMTSRVHGSEEALARLAIEALGDRPATRVLVGGLGMGYTVRAALDLLRGRPRSTVVVSEVIPEVVEWNRGLLAHLAGRPLDDPRVRVETGDVVELLRAPKKPFDAILLDVDNGPDALVLAGNRHLYSAEGLDRIYQALTPGGVFALWSTADDRTFPGRLQRHGFTASTHRVPSRASGKGGKHVVFLARRD